MRWTGQWPGANTTIAGGQPQQQQPQQPFDQQQSIGGGGAVGGSDDSQNVIGMDQLHQHIQQQLCSEQFHFLSQLQVCYFINYNTLWDELFLIRFIFISIESTAQ